MRCQSPRTTAKESYRHGVKLTQESLYMLHAAEFGGQGSLMPLEIK